jgi:hypothetical protein
MMEVSENFSETSERPRMPCINHDQYDIDGIRVERFITAPKDEAQRPALICVHGGCHASWSWQEHAAVYAAAGYRFTPSTGVVAAVRQRSTTTRW